MSLHHVSAGRARSAPCRTLPATARPSPTRAPAGVLHVPQHTEHPDVLATRAVATAAATILATASSFVAAPAAHACPTSSFYSLTSSNTRVPFKGIPTFKNGPGGTMSVTKDYTGSASYQVTAGSEVEVSGVLAKAKVSVSASLTKSNSSTVTNNYTHKISAGKYGHAQYVSWGKKINYKKQIFNSSCVIVTIATGTIKFPANQEGWYYWETNS